MKPAVATQVLAFWLLQVMVLLPPRVILDGEALIEIVGTGNGVTVTVTDCVVVPPAPTQVMV